MPNTVCGADGAMGRVSCELQEGTGEDSDGIGVLDVCETPSGLGIATSYSAISLSMANA